MKSSQTTSRATAKDKKPGYVPAEAIAQALGGTRIGSGWMALCPAHEDHVPSLAIKEGSGGQILVHCFAGCSYAAVVAELKRRGLWASTVRAPLPHQAHSPVPKQARIEAAQNIWRSTQPADGTLVQIYLRVRRIELVPPPALRYQPRLNHPGGDQWPAMVAGVTRWPSDEVVAVHRTYLDRDGKGKAPVTQNKIMLGPCSGGAVRLAPPAEHLMVGEGIETCLSAMQATGLPTWAALSTSGLKALVLPEGARQVTILADADEPGEAAARAAATQWVRQGRRVRIARPPAGMDFNNMLAGRRPEPQEVAS